MDPVSRKNILSGMPPVAVVLCTFNGASYIRSQLDAVICQTYQNLQILVTDDASTDETAEIIKEYAAADTRIRFSINAKNIGYNKNFEKTIGLCEADFIAFCDQDDIWELNKIEVMMNHWPANALFVYSLSGSFTSTDFANRKPAPDIVYTAFSDVHYLVFNSPVHGHASMMKKELYYRCLPFPEDIFYDWWISMHAAATGLVGCVPQTLSWHRVHQHNSSRNITSIEDKAYRNEQLRQQCVYFIETFCNRNILKQPQQDSLLRYAAMLKAMDGKKISWPMFAYAFKNRKLVFHYKKQKLFIFISYLKHSFKMAYKGLL